jgi:site-specific DNA-methyltransferase (adenine-specific)
MNAYNSYNPDVLTCLANLSSDEVFTPPDVVNKILDELPAELFTSPDTTFLDPCVKSGVFLREIAKRLIEGLNHKIPDLETRINHIFSKQLFGIATTELTSLISRRTTYCAKKADSSFSIVKAFKTSSGNIIHNNKLHNWKNGKCSFCNASQENYERSEDSESYAYEFIHTDSPERIFDMKFDVIVGNPPYQMSDGGFGKSAKPIYHKFVEQAKQLNPRYLIMIIPSRWFAGGKGLDDFRDEMLNDSRISKIVDYPDARDCFPGVDIAGGVCYFMWDKTHFGPTDVVNIWKGTEQHSKRKLNEFNTFVRFGCAADVIHKVNSHKEPKMNSVVSSRKPFGLPTNISPLETGDLTLITNSGEGKFPSHLVTSGQEMISKWKVLTSKVSYDHAGQPNKDGQRRVLSKVFIAPPNTVCTETYLVVAALDTEEECLNLEQFLKLKFTRFLIAQMSFSQDITKDRFSFVPALDWNSSYSDDDLYEKYSLDKTEIDFIEKTIMEMS